VTCLFVTGTDTGVGKTFVAAALARRARAVGLRVFAFKPVETGCNRGTLGDDQRVLSEAAGGWQDGLLCGAYRLESPRAPHVAAMKEGIEIDPDLIATLVRTGSAQADLTLVEGAGGWRVPLTKDHDMADLARTLEAQVVVVAKATLGTINHTLLTLEAIGRDGCSVASVILSVRPADDRDLATSNLIEIQRRWPGKVQLLEDALVDLDWARRFT
jgi:dethiobiotin synthetase